MKTKKMVLVLLLLWPLMCMAQNDDPGSRRGVQYATAGTDFWVCFPRTLRGLMPNFSRLFVVSERDCDLTITNDLTGYSQTYHVMHRQFCNIDTNYIEIPMSQTWIADTVSYVYLPGHERTYTEEGIPVPRYDYSGAFVDQPQNRGFHVTTTDTVSLYIQVNGSSMSECVVLPTEMLRDEYVAQPPIVNHHKYNDLPYLPLFLPGKASIDIVAVDDSVTVDIVLSDWDWLNRRPGDTLIVTLRKGQLYHIAAGEVQDKYYPLIAPYYDLDSRDSNSPLVDSVKVQRHNFAGDSVNRDTFRVDLAGTRIKARDCKRIAVFESSGMAGSGIMGSVESNMFLEQSVPVFYTGKEYLVPAKSNEYIRITAVDEGAVITIRDMAHPSYGSRTLTIPPGKTDWWEGVSGEGPYYITSDNPILVKWISKDLCTMTPTRWWHGGKVKFAGLNAYLPVNNVFPAASELHIFSLTEDIESFYLDSYRIDTCFTPLDGTPYSHAYFNARHRGTSWGTHYIDSRGSKPFMAFWKSGGKVILQHMQPSGLSLTVNGMPADSIPTDSIWCLYDPVTFQAQNKRPCDSLIWDFGDGTVRRFSYTDEGFAQPQVYTWHDTGRYTVLAIYKYQDEGCLTLKSDTLSVQLLFHNHHDSTFSVRLCEGAYTFRGHVLDYTDTHYVTTYWTESGCDTLWKIDFVTCPHCNWVYDTVALEDMPIVFNDITFGSEVHDEPIHLHISDSCDSIIYYTLIVIPYWGQKPIDSTWIIAPNVITPMLQTNSVFALACSPHILKAEVSIYDRRGLRMAQFDGLTGSWDGTSGGQPCQQGTYVYYIRYIDTADKGWKTLTGTVTLLR